MDFQDACMQQGKGFNFWKKTLKTYLLLTRLQGQP
jgi:hypothetical protein